MTVTSFEIRPATVDDAYGIARVNVDTWRDAYAGIVPDDDRRRTRRPGASTSATV